MRYESESLRNHVGEILNEIHCEQLVVIDCDLAKSTTSAMYRDAHPEHFIECGISETSAMSIASGLAMEGKKPVYVNFSMFLIGSAWTQLRQACYANLNITLIGTHPGMDDGPDGASHHANEDISLSRVLPNMRVLVPSSLAELHACMKLAIAYEGPVFIRCSRDVVAKIPDRNEYVSAFGRLDLVHDEGNDIMIIFEGTASLCAMETYAKLKDEGYHCKVVNALSIKPFDKSKFLKLSSSSKLIVSIENHSVISGLGGIVAENLSALDQHPKLLRIGVEDVFTESGKIANLKAKYGLDANKIMERIKANL
ncbi:MAG: transketolase family protein [Breznakia sp.]